MLAVKPYQATLDSDEGSGIRGLHQTRVPPLPSAPSAQCWTTAVHARQSEHGGQTSASGRHTEESSALLREIEDAVRRFPLPAHWKTVTTPKGESYYWNRVTDKTTWTHPLAGCIGEVLQAARDCRAAGQAAESTTEAKSSSRGSIASAAASSEARQRQVDLWAQKWHDEAVRELDQWRSVEGQSPGMATYFFRTIEATAPDGPSQATLSVEASGSMVTWEDPREELELRLRFRSETLAALVSPSADKASKQRLSADVAGRSQHHSRLILPTEVGLTPDTRPRQRRTTDGQWFRVEQMPADHSCGFHGLGVDRRHAARALLERSGTDPEVQDFVAADLAAALQTGERTSFPSDIRQDDRLWAALEAYYSAQQNLDEKRREAVDVLYEDSGATAAAAALAAAGGHQLPEAAQFALQSICIALKNEASATPSGPDKLRLMQRLGRGKTHLNEFDMAAARSSETAQNLKVQCHAKTDAYLQWVGSDHSFWLSFVRGCGGNDRGGGLLDALAKVFELTVRVWSESSASDCAGASSRASRSSPDLELLHEAMYGGRVVDLWYQGDRGHFDRLVQCSG